MIAFRGTFSAKDMDTSRCASSIFSDSQSDSDDSMCEDVDFVATDSAMVVLHHHYYDDSVNAGCERIAFASALVATAELDYEIGRGWRHALNMRLQSDDWQSILKDKPVKFVRNNVESPNATDTENCNTDDEERAQFANGLPPRRVDDFPFPMRKHIQGARFHEYSDFLFEQRRFDDSLVHNEPSGVCVRPAHTKDLSSQNFDRMPPSSFQPILFTLDEEFVNFEKSVQGNPLQYLVRTMSPMPRNECSDL